MNETVFRYLFPGMMFMWVFFIAQSAMDDINHERSRKTLMRLVATPVTINQIILSKILRCFLLCYIVETILIGFTMVTFGIHWGNLGWQFLVNGACNLAITGVLALIYGLATSKNLADGMIVIFILFSSFLGGAFIPYNEMPPFLREIGEWTIPRWSIVGMQAVMESKPLSEFWLALMKLLGIGIVTTLGGGLILKRRLERGETV